MKFWLSPTVPSHSLSHSGLLAGVLRMRSGLSARKLQIIDAVPLALHRLFAFRSAKTNVYPAVVILPGSDPVNPVIHSTTWGFLQLLYQFPRT